MTRLFARLFAALLLVLLPSLAEAQPQEKTFKHDFEGYTVYIEVAEHWLEVWRVDGAECYMVPSAPKWTERAVEFPAGTTWEVTEAPGGIELTFPSGRRLHYTQTDEEPEQMCGLNDRET